MVFSITFWPGLAVITTFLVAGAVNVKYELNNIGFLIVDKLGINYYKMKYFDVFFYVMCLILCGIFVQQSLLYLQAFICLAMSVQNYKHTLQVKLFIYK